jgi:hypothetical protein
VIVDMINNGKLTAVLAGVLTPALKAQGSEQALFGLVNARYEGYLAGAETSDIALRSGRTAPKYASRQYRLAKMKQKNEEELLGIYGEVGSALRLIETVLRLNLEGEFEFVKRLRLNDWLMEGLVGKGHFYTVPFTVKL